MNVMGALIVIIITLWLFFYHPLLAICFLLLAILIAIVNK